MSTIMVKLLVGLTGTFKPLCLSKVTCYQVLLKKNEDMNRV